jgi:hypothetical protein
MNLLRHQHTVQAAMLLVVRFGAGRPGHAFRGMRRISKNGLLLGSAARQSVRASARASLFAR